MATIPRRLRIWAVWSGAAIGVCLSAAPAGARANHFVSLLDLRQRHVVIQKWDLSCGAAALATLLTFQQDDPVSEKAVAEAMLRRTDPLKVRYRGGFSWLDLKRYVATRGYVGIGYSDLGLSDLNGFAPLIVPIRNVGSHHFVVFRGMRDGRVVLADPAWGNRTLPVEEFEAVWIDHLGFVVKRQDGQSPPNRLAVRATDADLLPSDLKDH